MVFVSIYIQLKIAGQLNFIEEILASLNYKKSWVLKNLTTGRNVALWKPTKQSSTYSEVSLNRWINFTSDKAVDGSGDGNFGKLSCTHTAVYQGIPTWNVSLGKAYSIIAIKIANRNDNRKYATYLFYILHNQVYGISQSLCYQEG